jgi:epoxyqueuosine reductase
MKLDDRVRGLAEDCGADLLGVADPSGLTILSCLFGDGEAAGYPRAISIGIVLLNAIVDQLPRRGEAAVAFSYRHHACDIVNERLDN